MGNITRLEPMSDLDHQPIPHSLRLRAGEWVQVRSKEEILSTLDKQGRLDELPFMPQMLQYCGQRFQVYKRAHKTCDTVNITGGRKMKNAVHLEALRCNGEAFGGCQAGCQLFWKEAWLERVDSREPEDSATKPSSNAGCTEADIWAATRASQPNEEPVYRCQATQLFLATERLPAWVFSQYIEDYTSGNVRFRQLILGAFVYVYYQLTESGLGFGSALRWVYNIWQKARGKWTYPWYPGRLPRGSKTPACRLDLQPGEWVTVRDQESILSTIDEDLKNKGMFFHGEMVPYCGKSFKVLKRIGQMIDEKTGKMVKLKNECIVLEGADCVGRYTKPRFCPRGCYPYWREIWLERAKQADAQQSRPAEQVATH